MKEEINLIVFNDKLAIYKKNKIIEFNTILDLFEEINFLDKSTAFIVNVNWNEKEIIKLLRDNGCEISYKKNHDFGNAKFSNDFGEEVKFKFWNSIIVNKYKGENTSVIKECLEDFLELKKYFPNFKLHNNTHDLILREWRESVGYEKNMKNKIIKEEYDFFKNWCTGGFFWYNELNSNKIVENVVGWDKYLYYSYIAKNKFMPIGEPIYDCDLATCEHKLGLLTVVLTGDIKEGKIPFVNLDQVTLDYKLDNITGASLKSNQKHFFEDIVYTTYEEFDLILEHYDILEYQVRDAICFNSIEGLSKDWVDKWAGIRHKTNKPWLKKQLKLGVNRVYGKQAEKDYFEVTSKEGKEFKIRKEETPYLPAYAFIINQSRVEIIRDAQKHFEDLLTIQCDSVYLKNGTIIEDKNKDENVGYYKKELTSNFGFVSNANQAIYWDKDEIKKIKHGRFTKKSLLGKSPNQIIDLFKERL